MAIINLGRLITETTVDDLLKGQGEFAVQVDRAGEALSLVQAQPWGRGARLDDSGQLIAQSPDGRGRTLLSFLVSAGYVPDALDPQYTRPGAGLPLADGEWNRRRPMTTLTASRPGLPATNTAAAEARPRFMGVLRGEFFKLSRQRVNWVMALGIVGITIIPYLYAIFLFDHAQIQQEIQHPPQIFLYYFMSATLSLQRVFVGIFLLVATARLFGLEYQNGTIRILLARGVGRLELLFAKLLAMALAGLALFAIDLVLNAIGMVAMVRVDTGSLDPINALTSGFWTATGVYILTVLVSMGVSILLAGSVTVVTRSLSFGLAGALGWFAADNIGVLFLLPDRPLHPERLLDQSHGLSAWPELNSMPAVVVPALTITGTSPAGQVISQATPPLTLGIAPFVNYDGTHALMAVVGLRAGLHGGGGRRHVAARRAGVASASNSRRAEQPANEFAPEWPGGHEVRLRGLGP